MGIQFKIEEKHECEKGDALAEAVLWFREGADWLLLFLETDILWGISLKINCLMWLSIIGQQRSLTITRKTRLTQVVRL